MVERKARRTRAAFRLRAVRRNAAICGAADGGGAGGVAGGREGVDGARRIGQVPGRCDLHDVGVPGEPLVRGVAVELRGDGLAAPHHPRTPAENGPIGGGEGREHAVASREEPTPRRPLGVHRGGGLVQHELERESGQRVYTVLQLRLLPAMLVLKQRLQAGTGKRAQIDLTYVTRRGPWYQISWKGDESKSGGLALNIGIHLFDLLLWLFGDAESAQVHVREPDRWAGYIQLQNADVRWYLSTRLQDLPEPVARAGKAGYRSLRLDGEELEFSNGFADLHTRVYENILQGQGFGLDSARASVELVYRLRQATISAPGIWGHPALAV